MSRTIELGTRCTGLRATGSAIWAACPLDGLAVRVDPGSGTVAARVAGLADARALAATDGGDVWVGFAGGLYATRTGTWARAQGDFLRYVDVGTAEVTRRISAPEQSGGDALVAYGYLWATAYDDDVLYRIQLDRSASAAPSAAASPTPPGPPDLVAAAARSPRALRPNGRRVAAVRRAGSAGSARSAGR